MDYEEKYNAALERAKKLQETCDSTAVVGWCEYIFPELQESEDEKIRKELMDFIYVTCFPVKDLKKKERFLDWLEKQGEQKPYGQRKECSDCQFNYAGECKGYCALKRNECKPTDKVEPKFHEGDWVIFNENHNSAYRVEKIDNYRYYLRLYLGGTLSVPFDSELIRLWCIKDAKDLDVLATSAGAFIYNGNNGGGSCPGSYCGINTLGDFQTGTESHWTGKKVYPATKEQRDLLFEKMKEDGYEWDGEKKELKKIKPKTLDADKVIEWLNDQACQGWIEDVEVDEFVDKFKGDFEI